MGRVYHNCRTRRKLNQLTTAEYGHLSAVLSHPLVSECELGGEGPIHMIAIVCHVTLLWAGSVWCLAISADLWSLSRLWFWSEVPP